MDWRLEQKIRSKVENQNSTQNQQQIQNINAHLFFAFTSALPAISSLHTAWWPSRAARCRAVHWSQSLEQKIRSTVVNQNTTQNQQQIQNINAHLVFAFTSALPAISSLHTAGWSFSEARCRAVRWPLEQKIRSKVENQNTTQNQQQIWTQLRHSTRAQSYSSRSFTQFASAIK